MRVVTENTASMQAGRMLVDTSCMLDAEADILALDLDCFQLLQGYRQAGLSEKAQRAKEGKQTQVEADESTDDVTLESDFESDAAAPPDGDTPTEPPKKGKFDIEKGDPWINRICELDGVEADHVCVLHGKLIAAGFLNFQIRDRHTGLEYRVANAGKQYLTQKLQHASEVTNSEGLEEGDDDLEDAA